jgi:hypothetical protein
MNFKPNPWLAKQLYGGIPESWKTTPDGRYPKALMIIVGADGFSAAEKDAFFEEARTVGVPEAMLAELDKFDYAKENLETWLKSLSHDPAAHRRLLYDSIRIAHADGYSDKERAAAAHAAKVLGVDARTLAQIEGLVEAERALSTVRASLFIGK